MLVNGEKCTLSHSALLNVNEIQSRAFKNQTVSEANKQYILYLHSVCFDWINIYVTASNITVLGPNDVDIGTFETD